MNLFVRSIDGKITARADSTRNKDKGEIYFPDSVRHIGYSPVVFCHMDRTGKAIGQKFVSRYYDLFSLGILLYPSASPDHFCRATAACYDHSSVLPLEMFAQESFGEGCFKISRGPECLFEIPASQLKEKLETAIIECSVPATIHKGDFVIAELAPVLPLHDCSRAQERVVTEFCGAVLSDISLR